MTKFERIKTVLDGGVPDRTPTALWFHFGGQFLSPSDQAAYYINVVIPQDWDLLKVMFDYRPMIPFGLDPRSKNDLKTLLEKVDWAEPFRKQRECLSVLSNACCNEIMILESGYSPWFSLLRWLGRDWESTLLTDRSIVPLLLDQITSFACDHVNKLDELGVYGYFHATISASKKLSKDSFDFQAKLDSQILSVNNKIHRFLHLHGHDIDISRVENYEFDVLNYSDRHPSNPSLAQARSLTSKCLMGGICENTITHISPANLEFQINREILTAGSRGLIIAPGCSVSPSVSQAHLNAIHRARNGVKRDADER